MKSGAFNKMIAESYTTPQKTLSVYGRFLKEAGLLTMGEKGWKAPDMTPLDAARMTIALLASDGPRHCVERVKLFGAARYKPTLRSRVRGVEIMAPDQFRNTIEGETLEEAIAYLFGMPGRIGVEESARWAMENPPLFFRVKVSQLVAELVWTKHEDGEETGELRAPFKVERSAAVDSGASYLPPQRQRGVAWRARAAPERAEGVRGILRRARALAGKPAGYGNAAIRNVRLGR